MNIFEVYSFQILQIITLQVIPTKNIKRVDGLKSSENY